MASLFFKSGVAAKFLGVHRNTLALWDKKGILKPHHVAPNGYKFYSFDQLSLFLRSAPPPPPLDKVPERPLLPSSSRPSLAEYHFYSTAKPIRRLKDFYLNQLVRVNLGRTGHVDVKLSLDRNLQLKLTPSPIFSPILHLHPSDLDLFIIESVLSLKVAGNTEFTAAQLLRHMHGNSSNGISNDLIKKIEDRLLLLMTWFIRIEITEEFSHYPNVPDHLKGVSAIQGHLLDLIILEKKGTDGNTRIFFRFPLNITRDHFPISQDVAVTHESYSASIGKQSCYATRLLDVPGLKKTEEALLLTNYLLQKIQGLKKNKKGICSLLFSTIERDCGMENYSPKKKLKVRHTLFRIIQNCLDHGKISAYEILKKGNRYHSIRFEW